MQSSAKLADRLPCSTSKVTHVASAVGNLLVNIVVAKDLVNCRPLALYRYTKCTNHGHSLTSAQDTGNIAVNIDDLDLLISLLLAAASCQELLTRAWSGSSKVNDLRLTSGRLTLLSVVPWLI